MAGATTTWMWALAIGATALTAGSPALAQTPDPCLTAPVDAQKLRKGGKLIEARDRFAICSRNACPREIVQSCMRWGAEVQSAIPSAVTAARDARGHDLGDVRVSIDGAEAVDPSPRAVELEPGTHRFVFRRSGAPGSQDVRLDVVLREGEKNREVIATFGSPPSPGDGVASEPSPGAQAGRVPLLTWVLGGLGVVALASFATSAALGIAERSADQCATGCTQAQKDDVNSKFFVADISLGVGVVALGVATLLYLVQPASRAPTTAWFDVRPSPGGAVGVVGARF
jgi:hypothetical protein